MDDLEWAKIGGGVFGAALIFMVVNVVGEGLYKVGDSGGHGEAHAADAPMPASIYELEEVASEAGAAAEEGPSLEELLASADADKGKKVYSKCKACHKLEAGANGTGPTLYAVVDRPIGSIDGFGYSNGMANHGGNWDAANLYAFLEKPKAFISDTKMSFAGLKKPTDRANVIAYLETVK